MKRQEMKRYPLLHYSVSSRLSSTLSFQALNALPTQFSQFPLHFSCLRGDVDRVRQLLDEGEDIHQYQVWLRTDIDC